MKVGANIFLEDLKNSVSLKYSLDMDYKAHAKYLFDIRKDFTKRSRLSRNKLICMLRKFKYPHVATVHFSMH